MNVQNLKQLLIDLGIDRDSWRKFANKMVGHRHVTPTGLIADKLNRFGYKITSEYGEGGKITNDDYYGVFSIEFQNEKNFFKISGEYVEYGFCDINYYDNFQLVKPVEVKKIEWQALI